MQIITLPLGPFEVNCYLVCDSRSGDLVVIDPGFDESSIIDAISQVQGDPKAVVLTHGHGDHIAAVKPIMEQYKVSLYVGSGDEALLANPSANLSEMIGQPIVVPVPDITMSDQDQIAFGNIEFTVLATPGHTLGGVSLYMEKEKVVFTGDTLFCGSIGRTDLPGGALDVLLRSIKSKLLVLPDDVSCLPGHGPKTTIGAERAHNPFLADDFLP